LSRQRPDLAAVSAALIRDGRVLVDGRFVVNPASQVTVGASLVVRDEAPLRGSAKLAAALSGFGVEVEGRVALDAGAAAGGFTRVLLEAGAARVYAVDVGHGQLVGSLRQDPRVVNLEGVNLGSSDQSLVPDPLEVVTLDLSYLSLAEAVPQLDRVALAGGADLVGLIKPMFELHLASAPTEVELLDQATDLAIAGVAAAGWSVVATMDSPVTGARGAPERLLHARRH
jgi:23S rRNA (cytidine1920-2'-O)/16S rRNA (cytidine1409-2'-O)-methyltransferase